MNTTFTYNGATVTVKRGTVRSRLKARNLYARFDIDHLDPDRWNEIFEYGRFVAHTVVEGKLPFPILNGTASEKDLNAAVDAFAETDQAFYDRWVDALNTVDSPDNDPAMTPDVEKKD